MLMCFLLAIYIHTDIKFAVYQNKAELVFVHERF